MNTAVFSVVNAVLLQPLSYPDTDRLVWIAPYVTDYESWRDNSLSRADYLLWRKQARSFSLLVKAGRRQFRV
jgi:putative ABC transport system permease protein